MKEQDLINMGFKKIECYNDYWYELNVKGGHKFITNDTIRNKRKDMWLIGYEGKENKDDVFWFNERLTEEGLFKIVFHLLVGADFKLAHQRNLIK